MNGSIGDALFQLSQILRWFEKYDESNACIYLARFLNAREVHDLESLEAMVKDEEARVRSAIDT